MTTKVTISRELVASFRRKTIEVEVPGYEGVFKLRQLATGAIDSAKTDASRGEELCKSLVDDDGNLIFDSTEGIAILNEMPLELGLKLLEAHFKLNGMTTKAVEGTIKNSETGQKDGSASA